ncbi:hypothetical protein GE115_07940 [Agromyces sp. CFH 90414]|uniref:YbaB/EbfC family DNA-binding protein n=1 Tax=Agromyces agglutinans TaxID=2662258 RepID=A0A6I2F7N5_9MICO|nr:hypothetical protein [Agromyces agglutinans]MRG59797.1 hypothetical protein [Agromyces agglutinans]
MAEHLSLDERLAEVRRDEPGIWLVADETDTVQVSVGLDGKLETLRLAPSWWRRVEPEELGQVVQRLRQASAASRAHTISELESAGADREPGTEALFRPAASSDAGSGGITQLRTRMGGLLEAFADLDRYRSMVAAATTEPAVLESPSGNAKLEIVGGAPRRLVIDRLNLQFTSEQALAAEILDLYERASRWLAERRGSMLEELPTLAGLVRSVRERAY